MLRSFGSVRYMNLDYILFASYGKSVTDYYLASTFHKDDLRAKALGRNTSYDERGLEYYTSGGELEPEYLSGILIKKQLDSTLLGYGNYTLISDIIDSMNIAMSYGFKINEQIDGGTLSVTDSGLSRKSFSAQDDKVRVRYVTYDNYPVELEIATQLLYINLSNAGNLKHFPVKNRYKDVLISVPLAAFSKAARFTSARTISYSSVLASMTDSSFVSYKKFELINNNEQVQALIVDAIAQAIVNARETNTLPVDVSLDVETSGLDCFDLPKHLQSRAVAIPISWENNVGYTICTDMEYLDNADEQFVAEVLQTFFQKQDADDSIRSITLSDGTQFEFRRSELFLIGHNYMFDIRALRTISCLVWFDADTRQLSFTLDPFITKGQNALKLITRKVFNCETPELVDILGEGNQDKFRYISDAKLAAFYGGCDADFTRLLLRKLREIYKDCENFHGTNLFKKCLAQDNTLMNIQANADYEGLVINRDKFVELGEKCLNDIQIIVNFAKECVGKILFGRVKTILEARNARIPEIETSSFEFTMKGNSLKETLFTHLNYPVLTWTVPSKSKQDAGKAVAPPQPAVNKLAMKRLMSFELATPSNIMKSDIMDSSGEILIKASIFNSLKYPIAYLVSLVGPLQKEYDAYYKPFITGKFGNKLFASTSFASIDTRRISNRYQTIKSSLKEYIYPASEDYYMCDFDISQVELRVMASLANDVTFKRRLEDPEVDPHIEVAAGMNNKSPSQISKSERSSAKSVSFGYPYGLGVPSMCEKIHNDKSEQHMRETFALVESFEKSRHDIIVFLNSIRDNTLKPLTTIPDSLRNYLQLQEGASYGRVQNMLGFYKLFSLDGLDSKKIGRIRRQAGNFPIQCTAAEIFRVMMLRFFAECEKRGWLKSRMVLPHLPIHDELLFSVHKDIDPIEIAKVLYKACVIRIPGHCPYFIGVAFGYSWGDCKKDETEIPLHMLAELSKSTDINLDGRDVINEIDKLRGDFLARRINAVIGNPIDNVMDVRLIIKNLTNYIIRKYVTTTYKPLYEDFDKENSDSYFASCLATWALLMFGDAVVFIDDNGMQRKLESKKEHLVINRKEREVKKSVLEDNTWDLDDSNVSVYSNYLFSNDIDEDNDEEISVNGTTIYDAGTVYKNFIRSPDMITIKTSSSAKLVRIPEHIANKMKSKGKYLVRLVYGAVVRTQGYVEEEDLADLDKILAEVI